MTARTKNLKALTVPALTFELGTVLEAAIEVEAGRYVIVHEWRGMHLLSDADAFDRARPKLYLVRSKPIKLPAAPVSQGRLDGAAKSYHRWHKRDADKLFELNAGSARYPLGRLVRLDYRSDKWHRKGKTVEYTHDFLEDGGRAPIIYADRKGYAGVKTAIASGGSMRVTEAGIA